MDTGASSTFPRKVLDHGYVGLVESWGSDQRIVEAARMSTGKGFLGWGPKCKRCGLLKAHEDESAGGHVEHEWEAGDEKLLRFLWEKGHASPFEMAGMTIEVKAPLMVFREWHRHRTQSYNEMSARYVPLPDENYAPTVERVLIANVATSNKQAQGNGRKLTEADALAWLAELGSAYEAAQRAYELGIAIGVPKEIARLSVPVGRYSAMRASANLRNWIGFLKLRCDPAAQWEIRQFAEVIADIMRDVFPWTYEVSSGSFMVAK